ncbi:MAG TPA: MOSC domain-containing protein, partial [Metalysinibacillus sp.]
AVCLYPIEHYEKWEKEFGKPLPKSAFGENLTVRGMLEQDVCIGDVYTVGEAVIEITQGRVPCSTIDKYTSASSLMKRLVQTGYTGYLARVLQEGMVRADDRITLQTKGEGQLTILKCNQIYFTNDQQAMTHLLTIPALADEWKVKIAKRLGK